MADKETAPAPEQESKEVVGVAREDLRNTDPVRKFKFAKATETPTHKYLAGRTYHQRMTDQVWTAFQEAYSPTVVK